MEKIPAYAFFIRSSLELINREIRCCGILTVFQLRNLFANVFVANVNRC